MSSNDRPFITLPADQPDYETLSGLTLEQKAALPARFHTPDWLDTTPGAFVCRVCWDEGEVTGWPCASALAGRYRVFADPVDAPASVASSEADTTAAREMDKGDPVAWISRGTFVQQIDATSIQVRDDRGYWLVDTANLAGGAA